MGFSEKDMEKVHKITVKELAMQLEGDLLNSCTINEEMTVYDYIKKCLRD